MDRPHLHPAETTLPADVLIGLAAIGEPNRARIVALLGHGEHCVCDVGEMLGLSTALVSHHLRTLRSAGLLRERKSGRWVHYSLDLERIEALRTAIADLLTPSASAAVACACSDCGTRQAATFPTAPRVLPGLAGLAP